MPFTVMIQFAGLQWLESVRLHTFQFDLYAGYDHSKAVQWEQTRVTITGCRHKQYFK